MDTDEKESLTDSVSASLARNTYTRS
eukprot:SAG31_NODE_7994_length_1545_cov_1.172891_1_plen_25_part_10